MESQTTETTRTPRHGSSNEHETLASIRDDNYPGADEAPEELGRWRRDGKYILHPARLLPPVALRSTYAEAGSMDR